MAAADGVRLTEEQAEKMADLMVTKLADMAVHHGLTGALPDHRPINRDEILMVIVDTELLLLSGDVDATLDRWAAGG